MQGILSASRRTSLIAVVVITAVFLGFSLLTARDLGSFGITLISGLFQGMLLFLVASGLSIIFGLMDVLNFAQGTYFMIGAYIAYTIHHAPLLIQAVPDGNLRFVIAALGATAGGAVLGVILERGLLRPLYSRPIFQIVMTFGVATVLTEIAKYIWGTTGQTWREPFGFRQGVFEVFGQNFSTYRLFVIAIGLILIVAIALLLRRTRIGIIIRAGVEDSQMVEALGINVRMVFTLVFTLGCAIAAFGGAIAAPFLGATPSMGSEFLLASIAVVVLGGLGSYEGTAIGSLLVGLAVAAVAQFGATQGQFMSEFVKTFIPPTVWPALMPMALLIAILLVRPSGLFGKQE